MKVAKNISSQTHEKNYKEGSLLINEELQETGVYFPNHPVVRYVAKTNISYSENACTKNYHLGGGIILFWCALHRICIGFLLLETAESCEYVYTTLVSRFLKIPKVLNLCSQNLRL